MALYTRARGSTGNKIQIFLPDVTSTAGAGKTGLTNASANLNISVRRSNAATMTAYTGANIGTIATLGTWVDPGTGKCNFKEVDSANAPGLYEIHFVDALFDTSDTSRHLFGMITLPNSIVPTPFLIELLADDNQVAKPANYSLLVIDGAGRLDVSKVGGSALNALIAGRIDANAQVVGDKTGYTAATVQDKTGYTASTVSDKTGYALTSGERNTLAGVVRDVDNTSPAASSLGAAVNAAGGGGGGGGGSITPPALNYKSRYDSQGNLVLY